MKALIAVVDDEPDIVNLVSINLEKAGFEVKGFADALAFLKSLERRLPDLVLLDVMLPDLDGFEVCRDMKSDARTAAVPIIMLTAKGDETDRVVGLELGADDYITKPFSVRELVARVKAVLRRGREKGPSGEIRVARDLAIDPAKFDVMVSGKRVELTSTEFKILAFLASRPGRVFTRDQILDHLWGQEKAVVDRTIDVHIRNLRVKLGRAAGHIKNVRGVGYKVEE
jgi:two-component system phosphate regulon response regulator PhoB/two-component system alkaline phosphatase synthesis response regulator PhoP